MNNKLFSSQRRGGVIAIVLGSIALVAILLVVGAVAFISWAGPALAQQFITAKTNFPVKAAGFNIDIFQGKLTLKDFEIMNSKEFGGGTFVKVPSFVFHGDLGSFFTNTYHIKEINLHVAEVAMVTNAQGQTNVDWFQKHLAPQGQTAPAQANAQGQTQKNPQVKIDKLALRVDSARVVDMRSTPPKTTNVNLGLNFERQNVTDLQLLQAELVQTAMAGGMKNLGPVAAQMMTNTAVGGVNAAANVTGDGLKAGLEGAAQATEKVGNILHGIKGIFGQ